MMSVFTIIYALLITFAIATADYPRGETTKKELLGLMAVVAGVSLLFTLMLHFMPPANLTLELK